MGEVPVKLKDIVAGHEYPRIMYRTNGPEGEDILFGYCAYTGGKLHSLDGDFYSLEDEIIHFFIDEENNNELVVYFRSEYKKTNFKV